MLRQAVLCSVFRTWIQGILEHIARLVSNMLCLFVLLNLSRNFAVVMDMMMLMTMMLIIIIIIGRHSFASRICLCSQILLAEIFNQSPSGSIILLYEADDDPTWMVKAVAKCGLILQRHHSVFFYKALKIVSQR